MYTISREMAYDLIRMYVERLHVGEVKHGMPGKKLEKWTVAKDGLTSLLVQIKLNGDDPDKILNDIKEELGIRFSHKELIIRIDGAARGNDNPDIDNKSALAFIIYGDGNEITRYAEYIGSHIIIPKSGIDDASVARATSNVAEYMSLISSLEYLIEKEITAPNIIFLSDSNVVVQQINGTNAAENIAQGSKGDVQKIILGMKNYNYYPDTITVKSGKPVSISLDSSVSGCLRSFSIRDFGVSKYARTPSETIDFVPTKKGTFGFSCSMGMGFGKIIVE